MPSASPKYTPARERRSRSPPLQGPGLGKDVIDQLKRQVLD
jgi:hypothetical protein